MTEKPRRTEGSRRPHCRLCGRFVPQSTVRAASDSLWSFNYGADDKGTCATHGHVDVGWEQP